MARKAALVMTALLALVAAVLPGSPAQAAQSSYQISFGHSGKCLTNPGFRTTPALLQQWTCESGDHQQWWFRFIGVSPTGEVRWHMGNRYSGLCVSSGGEARAPISQQWCANTDDFLWELRAVEGAHQSYRHAVSVKTGLCMAVALADSANGRGIVQAPCNNSAKNQYVSLS